MNRDTETLMNYEHHTTIQDKLKFRDKRIKELEEQIDAIKDLFDIEDRLGIELIRAVELAWWDNRRINWLADKNNEIGNVQLPRECVEKHIDSMRGAIDAAMAMNFYKHNLDV